MEEVEGREEQEEEEEEEGEGEGLIDANEDQDMSPRTRATHPVDPVVAT